MNRHVLASLRPVCKKNNGGKWGLPRYNSRPRLPMAISVRDFGNFMNTIRKSVLQGVVYYTVFLSMGNAMRCRCLYPCLCLYLCCCLYRCVCLCMCICVCVMGVGRVSHPRPLPPPLSFSSLSLSGFHERAGTWRNKLAR